MGPILNLIRKVRVEANVAHHHFHPCLEMFGFLFEFQFKRTYLPTISDRARAQQSVRVVITR